MPKIAIDVSPIYDGNAIRGVGYYTDNLVKSLQQEIKTNPDYKNWQIDLIKNSKENISRYDLIHYPYFDPFQLTLPLQKTTPIIVTIHDLIPLQFKNHFPVGIKGNIKWLIQKSKLKKVSKIITVSNYSKNIINQITKYPLLNIFTTYEGADSSFKPIKNEEKLKAIQKKYQLPNKFVLFVGDINWNKNIPKLVKACIKLKYPLVIVGSAATRKNVPNHPWTQDILWLQSKQSPYLILTGFVPDEDLPYFYNLATVYCQPSYAEGFGLPLIQAMQSGCPVAFSQDTSLPEIMDKAGINFNPRLIKDIRSALKKYWNSQSLREKYSQLGLDRAKLFHWSFTARQTLAVYKLALINEK
jgi:glycosyltransferase involved in cell wall biosynthesis